MGKSINMYVAAHSEQRGKKSGAGWLRVDSHNQPGKPHKKRLTGISSGHSLDIARIEAVSVMLNDTERNSDITVHTADENVLKLINNRNFVGFIRHSNQRGPKKLAKAAHSLIDGMARHHKVKAVLVTKNDQHYTTAAQLAFEGASSGDNNTRPGRKIGVHPNRKQNGKGPHNNTPSYSY